MATLLHPLRSSDFVVIIFTQLNKSGQFLLTIPGKLFPRTILKALDELILDKSFSFRAPDFSLICLYVLGN